MLKKLQLLQKSKTALILLAALCLAFTAAGCSDGEAEAFGVVDRSGSVFCQQLGNGWNLGNTLDACNENSGPDNDGCSTESSWGMPLTTKAMIKAVKAKGFKTIRIPVSYHNHITSRKDYKIDSDWMSRVKTVVDWAIEEGFYVIINIHHDNLSEAVMKGGTACGFCISKDKSLQTESLNYITSIWKQVCEVFKNYDEHLIFEVLNEPRAMGTSYEWSGSGSSVIEANKLICTYEQAALDVIRDSGEKNSSRYVMIPPYAASPWMMDGWKLPQDSAEGKLVVSVHAYTPYVFCMSDSTVSSFTNGHKGEISWLLANLSENFVKNGVNVVIGEMSASDKNNTEQRVNWAKHYCKEARTAGIPLVLWDNMVTVSNGGDIESGECHGYFNRKSLSWYFDEIIRAFVQ